MSWLRDAWAWVKRWGAAIAGVLLVVLGAGWLWRRQKAALGRAKDAAAIAEARREMDVLRATREEVARQVGEQDQAIAEIDARIAASKREIVDLHEGGEDIPDDQLDDVFARLGY